MNNRKINNVAEVVLKWINFGINDEKERIIDSKIIGTFIYEIVTSSNINLKKCLYSGKIYRYLYSKNFIKNLNNIEFNGLYYSWTKNEDFIKIAKFNLNYTDGIIILEGTTNDDYGLDVVKFLKYCNRIYDTNHNIIKENEIIFPMKLEYIKQSFEYHKFFKCEDENKVYVAEIEKVENGNCIITCPYCNKVENYYSDAKAMNYEFISKSYKVEEILLNKYEIQIVNKLKETKF